MNYLGWLVEWEEGWGGTDENHGKLIDFHWEDESLLLALVLLDSGAVAALSVFDCGLHVVEGPGITGGAPTNYGPAPPANA